MRMTFEARQTHPLPDHLPAPPSNWTSPYRRLARESGLPFATLREGWEAASIFLQPVLTPPSRLIWHPDAWEWIADA
jgi:hypothetical protein